MQIIIAMRVSRVRTSSARPRAGAGAGAGRARGGAGAAAARGPAPRRAVEEPASPEPSASMDEEDQEADATGAEAELLAELEAAAAPEAEVEAEAEADTKVYNPDKAIGTGGTDKIYIGKPKLAKTWAEDELWVTDDVSLYPGKEDVGPFMGAVGGFAGGEVGLKDSFNQLEPGQKFKAKAGKKKKDRAVAATGRKDKIYIGKPKGAATWTEDDLWVKDDVRFYPGKEDVGPFSGAVGGFAGGEVGLKDYFAAGKDLPIAEDGEGGQPQSPLVVGFGLGMVGLLATLVFDNLETLTDPEVQAAVAGKVTAFDPQQAFADQDFLVKAGLVAGAGAVGVGTVSSAVGQAKRAATEAASSAARTAVQASVVLASAYLATQILFK